MKRIIALLVIAVAVLGLISCKKEAKKIGFAASTLSNPFFKDIQFGIEAGLKKSGYKLVTLGAADDAAKQGSQIEDLIAQGIEILILNPVNSLTVGTKIKEANKAGIPVITVDRGTDSNLILTHIASDNVAGGKMAGEFLKTQNADNLPVLELIGVAGNSATTERSSGFRAGLGSNPDFSITANFNRAEGQTVTENYLNTLADTVTGIAVFAANDEMALGAVMAIKANPNIDLVNSIIIGFDATTEAVNSINREEMLATIAQQPKTMGELAAKAALDKIANKPVPVNIPVPLALIKKH